ncbi:hypothetical protein M405DRAFT_824805, partial [Rhizopogon salebrosus TDB-379]
MGGCSLQEILQGHALLLVAVQALRYAPSGVPWRTMCLPGVSTFGTAFPVHLLGLDLLKGTICLLSSICFGYGGLVVISFITKCRCQYDAYRYGVYGVVTCEHNALSVSY